MNSFPLQQVTDIGINKVADNAPISGQDPHLTFCSPLSFEGITWNKGLTLTEQRSMAIALSISGAFEGGDGWSNITNNFDGMGLSAGLLNQTLGTDSLQPLLAEMQSRNETVFNSSFSASHLRSIGAMLEEWKNSTSWKPKSLATRMALATNRDALPLDSFASSQSASVSWAKFNLYYVNGTFIPSWKNEIQSLLNQPAYISLQVEAAGRYHAKAMEYLHRIGIYDLRAYLLMFDIITQNGSIKESRFVEWAQKVQSLRLTSIESKLMLLVDLRVLDSDPQWQADVRARKYTLINGFGKVHGKTLNLTKAYCYAATDPVR